MVVAVAIVIAPESLVAPVAFTVPLALLPLFTRLAILNAPLELGDALMHDVEKLALKVPPLLVLPRASGPLRHVVEILLEPLDPVPQVRHLPLELFVLRRLRRVLLRAAVQHFGRVLELALQVREIRRRTVGLARCADRCTVDVAGTRLVEAASGSVVFVLVDRGILTSTSAGSGRAVERPFLELGHRAALEAGRSSACVVLQNILQEIDRSVQITMRRRHEFSR